MNTIAAVLGTLIGVGIGFIALVITARLEERKNNGRHRRTAEAHRTGTGGSTGDGAHNGTGNGTSDPSGGTGQGAGAVTPPATPLPTGGVATPLAASGGIVPGGGVVIGRITINPSGPAAYPAFPAMPSLPSIASFPPFTARRGGLTFAPGTLKPTDFAGLGFAPGVVRGMRSWAVDEDYYLRGINYAIRWNPGENHAKCLRLDAIMMYISPGRYDEEHYVESERGEHHLTECNHGFYAYYEGSNDYRARTRVSGVIEGYGEVIIGTRGFRCTKARIVALCLHAEDDPPDDLEENLRKNYPDVPIFHDFDKMVAEYPAIDANIADEAKAKLRQCGFRWKNSLGEWVQCTSKDGLHNGTGRHVSGSSWVNLGAEESVEHEWIEEEDE